MQQIGKNVQQGQQALNGLHQSIESNLQLADHAETWSWKEVEPQTENGARSRSRRWPNGKVTHCDIKRRATARSPTAYSVLTAAGKGERRFSAPSAALCLISLRPFCASSF